MDLTAVLLLLLDRGDLALKDHTKDFLDLVCLTYYPDHFFYCTSLSEQSKAHLPVAECELYLASENFFEELE